VGNAIAEAARFRNRGLCSWSLGAWPEQRAGCALGERDLSTG
jgi:hypothetical protein